MMRSLTSRRFDGFRLLVAPSVVLTVVFVVVPFAYGITLSFQKMQTILDPADWVGFDNYLKVLASGRFWEAALQGTLYAFVAVAVQIVLGLLYALVLNESFKGRGIARAVAIAPYVVPPVVGVQIFKYLLDSNSGLISGWTGSLGWDIQWFARPGWAMFTVILISVWLWTPFATIVVLAGLQNVSAELHDAARVDGAGVFRRFGYITLPAIVPVMAVVALLRGIWMFNKFDVIYLATGGGPVGSTENVPVLSYLVSFGSYDMGRGAAIAALNFVFVAALAYLYMRATRMHKER